MFTRTLIGLTAVVILASCASPKAQPTGGGDLDSARLTAFAATAKYPADIKAGGTTQLIALFEPHSEFISIVNVSDGLLRDVNVWVNRTYVCRAEALPPHATVELSRKRFYDAGGLNMDKLDVAALRVDLQDGDRLYLLERATYR